MTLRLWHRWFGAGIGVFVIAHLSNHAALWWGHATHIAVMDSLRIVYRNPVVETLLLCGLAVQVFLGLRLILKRGKPHDPWAWAQVLSGAYLGFFLLQHVPAVLVGRLFQGLDTNIYFAAAPVVEWPYTLYFAPYYALSIAAVFTHLAAAWRFAIWPRPAPALWVIPLIGLGFGVAVVSALMDISVPDAYRFLG